MDADITEMLKAWSAGDQAALEQLSKVVYERPAFRSLAMGNGFEFRALN